MLFFVCGIPHESYPRFQSQISKIFGDGHRVISSPRKPRGDGRYCPDMTDARNLISQYCRDIEGHRKFAEKGCGLVVLRSPGVNIDSVLAEFHPFALPTIVELPVPTVTIGKLGSEWFNKMASRIEGNLRGLRTAIRAISTELEARRNRTPLLLPMRNFASAALRAEISTLYAALSTHPDPRDRIKSACQRIEESHPFTKQRGRFFLDEKGVRFQAPGRALHGFKVAMGSGHLEQCLTNEHLRLGGGIPRGFHFDCTIGEKGNLSGKFPNCHDTVTLATGRPHLNIYPNDFVR